MQITVAKETRFDEQRVSLTPETVSNLRTLGVSVVVETEAGAASGFDDDAYRSHGASIATNQTQLYQKADIVAWVKRPETALERLLPIPPGAIIIGFLDTFKPGDHMQYFAQQGFTTLSWDLIAHVKETKHIDASAAMGKYAGKVACLEAIKTATTQQRQPQYLTILIVGSGNAGLAAAQQARQTGNKVLMASTRRPSHRVTANKLVDLFVLLPQEDRRTQSQHISRQRKMLSQIIMQHKPDVIITTAHRFRQKPPTLITDRELDLMKPGTIIEDLTATTGGNTIYSEADREVRLKNAITIRNKSNYPSQDPEQASESYSQCLWHLLKRIIMRTDQEPDYALNKDALIAPALAVYQGRLNPRITQNYNVKD